MERQASKSQSIRQQQNQSRPNEKLIEGKERILQLLKEAGIVDLDDDMLSRLPTWGEVMYVATNDEIFT